MKKKIIAISLITTMIICNSMTVWAADKWTGSDETSTYIKNTDGNNADSVTGDSQGGVKNVKGSYDLSGSQVDTYNVEISWGALTYEMAAGATTGTWDPAGHYVITDFVGWESTNATVDDRITVTNRSNVAVTATFTGTVDPTFISTYGVTGQRISFTNLTDSKLSLVSLEGAGGTAESKSTDVSILAPITKAPSLKGTGVQLGTVTVTIAKQ